MSDRLDAVLARLAQFRDDRDWRQFHRPHHLAAAIAIEAAELQELFLWLDDDMAVLAERKEEVEDELADILITALNFALAAEIDPLAAVEQKIEKNEKRYPVESSRGSAIKYTDR